MSHERALEPRRRPSLYFIGVSTGHSSILETFPRWSSILGLGAEIVGYDAPLDAPAAVYRRVVAHLKRDPLALGALVTTHKIDLLAATRELFDDLDPYARLCAEVSCISKRGGRLIGHAKDPISSGAAWAAFVPGGHWARTGGRVLCLGAGGAATAISVHVAALPEAERPEVFFVVDRSASRLERLAAIHARLDTTLRFSYLRHDAPAQNDALVAELPAGSMVINATGLGKDRPGSPLGEGARFPVGGLVWELNYRGELDFLRQARAQQPARALTVEDGWTYFLHGWTQVIAEVFDLAIDAETFAALAAAAR